MSKSSAEAPSLSSKGTVLASTETTINVISIIDTDYIKARYPRSTDPNNPVGIDHSSEYMVCPSDHAVSGQGTADLTFSAAPGDTVSLWGVSASNNSDDAVIIYGVQPTGSTNIFNPFVINEVSRSNAAVPNPQSNNGIPAVNQPLNFYSYDAKVKGSGQELFVIQFGIYSLDESKETQTLWGYYQWDPTITVQ